MAQTIIVDTTPGYRMPTIYYSQGDIGRTFSIDLQSRFGESLPASPTITIQATKPSGLGFSVGSTSISGAVVTFTVTETMSNEAGRFPAELKIVKNSVTLFTANFYIDCEANAHPEGTTDGDIDHIMPKFMSVTTTTLPAGDSATYSFDANTNTATFGIPKGADGSLASQVLAADYSSSKTYAVGDYVYYSGNLYRCTTAITTAEAWTSGHWTQVALANDVSDVKSALSGVSYKYSIDNTAIGSSGGAFSNTEYCCTDFIEIGEKSFFSLVDVFAGSSSLAYAFYKEDKSFISGQNNVSGDVYVDTIPQYACFVRFGTKKTNDNTGKTTEHTAVVNNCDVFTQKVIPKKTSFFEGFNIMDTGYPVFRNDRFIDASGMHAGTNTWTVVFEAEPNTDYYIMIPSRNRQTAMVSPKNPFIDQTGYTYFSPILYTKYNGENIYRVKTESNSHYIGFYFYSGEYDLSANRDDILIIKDSWIANPIIHIRTDNTIRHYGTFSILGDSYSTFEDYLTPQNAGHWYPSTLENNVTEIEQTWWYKFANQYGCSLKENVSWSGSTISYDGYGDGHADGKTISFITRMDNLSNPELILVYGGTNDSWVATESGRADFLGDYKYSGFTESDFEYFRPSVAYVLTELRKKHVGSHIVFMLNSNLTNIRESVQTICEHLNIPLCEMYGLDLTNAHPNQTGMQQIADYITDFLNVGN